MGFWGSLVSGAASIGNWVANNSGSIVSAVGTIARIAGKVLAEEDILADNNLLATLSEDLDEAANVLAGYAKKEYPAPKIESEAGFRLKGPYELPAFWPEPTTETTSGIPPVISADVNKFLALNRLPNTLGEKSNATDIGNALAQLMFATQSARVIDRIGDIPIRAVDLKVTYPNNVILSGGNVWYQVPLGNSGHAGWHSCIRLWLQSTQKADEAIQAERKSWMVMAKPMSEIRPEGGSYNSVTLSVQWNGARSVAPLMKKALDTMLKDRKSKIELMAPAVVDGTKFTYQFHSDTNMGPAVVAAKMSGAVTEVLPPVTDTHSLPRMPDIKIENMATFIG
ncbi:MAG: hypothetical protein Q9222_006377 [Ikaeria aurantiellina]